MLKRRIVLLIISVLSVLSVSCSTPRVVMPTPDTAKAVAATATPENTSDELDHTPEPAPTSAEQSINPKNHRIPEPDVIIIIGRDVDVELMPGTEEYGLVLNAMSERVQRELGMSIEQVPDDDPDMQYLLASALSVVFKYSSLMEETYSFDGFRVSVSFTRLLMPLEAAESIPDAAELMYFGNEFEYFSEPARIDPPSATLIQMARELTGENK